MRAGRQQFWLYQLCSAVVVAVRLVGRPPTHWRLCRPPNRTAVLWWPPPAPQCWCPAGPSQSRPPPPPPLDTSEHNQDDMGFITGGPTEAIVVSGCFHSKPLIVVRDVPVRVSV